MPHKKQSKLKPASRWNPYPFDDWFLACARGAVVLRRGRDYACQTHGMAQQVRQAAFTRGITLRIEIDGDTIRVNALGRKRA